MPRLALMKRELSHSVVSSVNELMAAVTRLVASVGEAASASASSAASAAAKAAGTWAARVSGHAASRVAAAGEKGEKLSHSIKAHWDSMTAKQRAARVKKMLAGRGLKPKPKKKGPPSKKSLALRKAISSHWAKMTASERAARVRRMLAGRGLKPKAKPKR